jgi:hypothetical protein
LYIESSWAIPFASGGLTDLYLAVLEPDETDLDAILAIHADTLERLEMHCVGTIGYEFGRGPGYKLNMLEFLSMATVDRERRVSSTLLELSDPGFSSKLLPSPASQTGLSDDS